ncbi:MAG: cytidine deaminase [Vicingaceae bacterium]
MKTQKSLHLEYTEYTSLNSLPKLDQKLLYKAIEASKNAYAKYSNFQVGAAVLLNNGEIVIGSNQENAAYPSGLCAERVALFSASSQFSIAKMETLAIYASDAMGKEEPVSPCGACRQVMMEYELKQGQSIRLLLLSEKGKVWEFESVKELFPFAFVLKPSKK